MKCTRVVAEVEYVARHAVALAVGNERPQPRRGGGIEVVQAHVGYLTTARQRQARVLI